MTEASPSWTRGLALLRQGQRRLPDAVARTLASPAELPRLPWSDVRAVVTTGIGSSLAHARYLAHLLRTRAAVPAWDLPVGAFVVPPEAGARELGLVVFSQRLSPNARVPLACAEPYRFAVLVTAAVHESGYGTSFC